MAKFLFRATDRAGLLHEGQIEAASSESAYRELAARGLTVRALIVQAERLEPAGPVRPPLVPSPAPVPAPSVRTGRAPAAPAVVRTPAAKARHQYFFFEQLASLLQSGISPAQAALDLAPRMAHGGAYWTDALREIGRGAAEGWPLSDGMSRYPNVFPDYAVALLRAGEAGGYTAEASARAAEQLRASASFQRSFWYVWLVLANGILILPVLWLMFRAVPRMLELAETTSGPELISAGFGEALRWPVGPVTALALGGLVAGWFAFRSPACRRLRHRLVGWLPAFGRRSRHEGFELFAWALSKATAGGASPRQAWVLAAECVPNVVLRERLADVGRRMGDGDTLSRAVQAGGVLPPEYAAMLTTAEQTGDLPGALGRVANLERESKDAAAGVAKWTARAAAGVLFLLGGGVAVIGVAYLWYRVVLEKVLGDR
ncbi:MAG: type II secretion system F family protein [Fimbriimonadaceae bacterium]